MRNQSKNETRLTGKVVLDAMGSDNAPHAEIDGALAAARDLGVVVILVGQPEKIEPELRRCGWRGDGDRGIELVEAAEVIGMDDPVATSVRRKKKSSLRIGTKLVTEGRADGFVSAGNTGAAMATAKMVIGMLPGVDRPALAALIPTKSAKPTCFSTWAQIPNARRITWCSLPLWARLIRAPCWELSSPRLV